jgi:ribonuclease Z
MVFLFQEKQIKKLNLDAVKNFEIDTCYYQNIKTEKDIMEDGRFIENSQLTFDPIPPKSYAFVRIPL